MILVDTSVWIRYLNNKAPYAEQLERLLDHEQVGGHEFVYGELLIGDSRGERKILADYRSTDQARTVSQADVVAFVRGRKLNGRGVGWIDVHLLASALVERWPLWTADCGLAALALELGIAHTGSAFEE